MASLVPVMRTSLRLLLLAGAGAALVAAGVVLGCNPQSVRVLLRDWVEEGHRHERLNAKKRELDLRHEALEAIVFAVADGRLTLAEAGVLLRAEMEHPRPPLRPFEVPACEPSPEEYYERCVIHWVELHEGLGARREDALRRLRAEFEGNQKRRAERPVAGGAPAR